MSLQGFTCKKTRQLQLSLISLFAHRMKSIFSFIALESFDLLVFVPLQLRIQCSLKPEYRLFVILANDLHLLRFIT